jgi:hypothetical protein
MVSGQSAPESRPPNSLAELLERSVTDLGVPAFSRRVSFEVSQDFLSRRDGADDDAGVPQTLALLDFGELAV